MVTKAYDISKLCQKYGQSAGEDGKCNIVLNDANYTYISGLIHVDYSNETGILFTSEAYDEYAIKNDVINIIRLLRNQDSLYSDNIKIVNIRELIWKLIESQFPKLRYSRGRKIGINYRLNSIDMIYRASDYTPINIVSSINNIKVDNLKENIYNSIHNLLININTFIEDSLDSVLYETFNNLTTSYNSYINLNNDNIEFLKYMRHSSSIVYNASQELDIFEKLMAVSNTSLRELYKSDKLLKNTSKFKLLYKYEDMYNSELIFKFGGVTIPVYPNCYYKDLKFFVIAYLMYLNEYENLIMSLKGKLFKTM